MVIGKLDRRIEIQRATASVNGFGEREYTWTTIFTIWANLTIRKSGTSETLVDGQETATKMAEWTIRSSSQADTITTADRVKYGAQIQNIVAVHELQRGVDIRLVTEIVE